MWRTTTIRHALGLDDDSPQSKPLPMGVVSSPLGTLLMLNIVGVGAWTVPGTTVTSLLGLGTGVEPCGGLAGDGDRTAVATGLDELDVVGARTVPGITC